MTAALTLFLDLGDVFTKGLGVGETRRERVRFPSVVAHTLLRGGPEMASLLLDEQVRLPRLSDFDERSYPRTRSFRGAEEFVRVVQDRPPVPGARFAGGIAAVHGADRQLLGMHPSHDNVDALVRKALLLVAPEGRSAVDIVFVVDLGTKAAAIQRYAEALPAEVLLEAHNYRAARVRQLQVGLTGRCVDALECARAALPAEVTSPRVAQSLVMDIGYLRTKFAVISQAGCLHQEQAETLGVCDCVYRILRDGQEHGLMEDEFAIIRALEDCEPERFEVAGRSFDVRQILDRARRALEDELVRAARRIILEQYQRSGKTCGAVAVIGGGATLVGRGVADRLERELGLTATWVADAGSDSLVDGAARIVSSA